MARTGRPGVSAEQKKELWCRWKAGETLSEIGRALGKHAASVFAIVVAKGGIAPPVRMRKPGSLTPVEREEISRGLVAGFSYRHLGRQLGRTPSTISREVARNGGRGKYRSTGAEDRAWHCAPSPQAVPVGMRPRRAKVGRPKAVEPMVATTDSRVVEGRIS